MATIAPTKIESPRGPVLPADVRHGSRVGMAGSKVSPAAWPSWLAGRASRSVYISKEALFASATDLRGTRAFTGKAESEGRLTAWDQIRGPWDPVDLHDTSGPSGSGNAPYPRTRRLFGPRYLGPRVTPVGTPHDRAEGWFLRAGGPGGRGEAGQDTGTP